MASANSNDIKNIPPADTPAPEPIKVPTPEEFSIYRVGIRKIFALEDDMRVVAQAESLGQTIAAAEKHKPDVILFEAAITTNPAEAVSEILKRSSATKIVVAMVEPDEDDTVDLFRRGVRGIVSRSISPDLLVKCVRKVQEGETWLDNKGVNWVLEAYRSQAAHLTSRPPKSRLSDKELLIISCVSQGMRNKEIAKEINTTEQVIKNYLRKIYDKLGVSDRLELALYCIHHQILKSGEQPGQPQQMASEAPDKPLPVTQIKN